MPIAFVLPGQGSWRADALSVWAGHPAARVLDEVEQGLEQPLDALTAGDDVGARTAKAQPAILAASLVAHRALADAGITPDLVAGHSLGECTAAAVAGVYTPAEAARLVRARGEAMADACARHPGGLLALVRLERDVVDELVATTDAVVANDNAPGQVVIAGPHEALQAVAERAREHGGRALPVEVEGAFHSPAMAPAHATLSAVVDELPARDPGVTMLSATTAAPVATGAQAARAIVDGLRSPVRWRETQLALQDAGATALVELGPGGVLRGLARRTVPDLPVHAVAGPDDVDALRERLAPAA